MTDRDEALLSAAEAFAKSVFEGESTGHDWPHTQRVFRTAMKLAAEEGADPLITGLAALLHDTDDRKISPETSRDLSNARSFLEKNGVDAKTRDRILAIIRQVSFAGKDSVVPDTAEGCCVQDADRLDATGAIGIARTFAYGGAHGRPLWDPSIPIETDLSREAYEARETSSVHHFYEKLFLLKDLMNTRSARSLAEKRENLMREYLAAFLAEWNGIDG